MNAVIATENKLQLFQLAYLMLMKFNGLLERDFYRPETLSGIKSPNGAAISLDAHKN